MGRAVEQLLDGCEIEVAGEPQHAEHVGARRLRAHQPGRRGLAAERVIDEAGDGGAVAGAGEAVAKAPVLQRVGGGAAAGVDVGEDLDGGLNAGGRDHDASLAVRGAKIKRDVRVSGTGPLESPEASAI